MGKKVINIKEGKLSEFKLHSIWLRERINGAEFLDQNNLQRLYEPSLLEDNLLINAFVKNKNCIMAALASAASIFPSSIFRILFHGTFTIFSHVALCI